jgi:uncharacterized protein (UPF0332 family)
MSLADKEKRNKLKKHKPTRDDISRLLAAVQRRLDDAGRDTLYNETKLEQAYEAVLLCSKAALQAVGYRVRQGEGHHYESIDSLQYTLGTDGKLVKYFQALRRKRHKGLYEGLVSVPDSEVDDAIKSAQTLYDELRAWLEDNHPGLYERKKD